MTGSTAMASAGVKGPANDDGPLAGTLVVSVEQAVAGPLCTLRLADAGARVIKVEAPTGDRAREYDDAVGGTSACFAWLNRGKESMTLDLKKAEEMRLLKRILLHADVFVQNLAPGASERLGLGGEALRDQFPNLIVINVRGYRRDSTYSDKRAYDMLVQAESGICAVTGTPDTPSKVGVSIADIGTGTHAYAAVLEALIARGRSGQGCSVDVAMFDGMAEWMSIPLLHYEQQGVETGRYGLSHASVYPYRPYACLDGDVVISVQSNAEWRRFCQLVLNDPGLSSAPEFSNNMARVKNRAALDRVISNAFAQMTCAGAIERLEAGQIAWGRVSTLADLSQHPALARILVLSPEGHTTSMPRPAGRVVPDGKRIPRLGEDTERLRKEFSRDD